MLQLPITWNVGTSPSKHQVLILPLPPFLKPPPPSILCLSGNILPDLFWGCEIDYCVEVSTHIYKKKKTPRGTTLTSTPPTPPTSSLPPPPHPPIPPFPQRGSVTFPLVGIVLTGTKCELRRWGHRRAGVQLGGHGLLQGFKSATPLPYTHTHTRTHRYSISISHNQTCRGGK